MPVVSNATVRLIAQRLGHADLIVRPSPRGFRAFCSCGYASTTRRTVAHAADAAAHHLELLARAWIASGAPLPIDDTPSEETFESRTSSVSLMPRALGSSHG